MGNNFLTKKIMQYALIISACFSICSIGVYAEHTACAVFDEDKKEVVFFGKAEIDRSLFVNDVSVVCLKPGMQFGDIENDGKVLFFAQLTPDIRGNFKYGIEVGEVKGLCNVLFSFSDGEKRYLAVSVLSEKEKEDIIREFNSIGNIKEAESFFEKYRDYLSLNKYGETNESVLYKYFINRKVTSAEEITALYNRECLIAAINSQDGNISEFADEYIDKYYKGDICIIDDLYRGLGDKEKIGLLKSGGLIDSEDADKSFIDKIILYAVNHVNSKVEYTTRYKSQNTLKDYIKRYNRDFAKILEDLSEVETSYLLGELAAKSGFSDMESFSKEAKAIIEKTKLSENNEKNNGGSSGGSGVSAASSPKRDTGMGNSGMKGYGNNGGNEGSEFADIDDVEWARKYICLLRDRQIISGREKNMFMPHDRVTRAEFAKMITMATGAYTKDNDIKFIDVDEGKWYSAFISSAASAGYIKGTPDGRFMPEENITRQDLALIIYNAYGDILDKQNDGAAPNDFEVVSDYAREAVLTMVFNGIMVGDENGCFNPKSFATRAEAARIVGILLEIKEGGL